jgi:hypothetical protein
VHHKCSGIKQLFIYLICHCLVGNLCGVNWEFLDDIQIGQLVVFASGDWLAIGQTNEVTGPCVFHHPTG